MAFPSSERKEDMAREVKIDGVEYVEKTEGYLETSHVCVIADRGWIFEGYRSDDSGYELTNAHVVRKWDNGLGIGALAKAEHKDDYTLDEIGCITVNPRSVIAVIPLEW